MEKATKDLARIKTQLFDLYKKEEGISRELEKIDEMREKLEDKSTDLLCRLVELEVAISKAEKVLESI